MEKIKTRFIIAVTQRLAAAADTTAKVELIEELSDNLYSRWQDLTANGADEEKAYALALEDLGDLPIWTAWAPRASCQRRTPPCGISPTSCSTAWRASSGRR